jgi:hypothetical protein
MRQIICTASFRRRLGLVAASCIALSGCAYSYVDEDGARHVIGLVDLKLLPSHDDAAFAGHVVDLSTLGISLNENPSGSSFTIGYSREVSGYLRNHVLVVGDPLALRTATTGNGAEK